MLSRIENCTGDKLEYHYMDSEKGYALNIKIFYKASSPSTICLTYSEKEPYTLCRKFYETNLTLNKKTTDKNTFSPVIFGFDLKDPQECIKSNEIIDIFISHHELDEFREEIYSDCMLKEEVEPIPINADDVSMTSRTSSRSSQDASRYDQDIHINEEKNQIIMDQCYDELCGNSVSLSPTISNIQPDLNTLIKIAGHLRSINEQERKSQEKMSESSSESSKSRKSKNYSFWKNSDKTTTKPKNYRFST
jgi:hypothetical protein